MISRCANPSCDEPFLYFRHGKIFAVPRRISSATRATIEYFWLCRTCAKKMALEFHQGDQHPALVWRDVAAGISNHVEYEL
jgi:hypothetical protein